MAGETILVIDDEITSRKPCALSLKASGYNVLEAECGEDGVEIYNAEKPDFVLSDLMMPGINGIEVLKQVKEADSNCPVIIMTAYNGVETGVEAIKLGAYDYIVKPIKLDELHFKIERALEKTRLAQKIQELDETVALYEISQKMFSTVNLNQLLEIIADSTLKVLSAEQVSLMLFDDTGKLYIPVSRGLPSIIKESVRLEIGESIAGKVVQTRQPVIISDDSLDESEFGDIAKRRNLKSSIICPLLAKNEVLGVINISRINIKEKFEKKDLRKAVIFASQMASAIENARLFRDLEREKEKIEVMFSGMGDGAIVADSRINVIMLNKSASLLLGVEEEQVKGKNFFSIIETFEVSPIQELEGKKVLSFEMYRKGDLPLYLSVLTTKIYDGDKAIGQVMILRNVTEERREALVKKNFISTISHKLRTPLTSIISAVSVIKVDKSADRMMTDKAVDIISSQSWELNDLVTKLIRFSKVDADTFNLHREKRSLKEIVDAAVKEISKDRNIASVLKVENDIDPGCMVFVDQASMREVFESLIDNAYKFNDSEEKKLKITSSEQGSEFIRLELTDNGIGIPSEELENIFGRFYQVEAYFTGQIRGAGLGLTLARKIIEEHDGKIWAESRLGEYTKVIIVLPKP